MSDTEPPAVEVNKNKKYRKPKPWDTDDIDHWKIQQWSQDDDTKTHAFLEESSFQVLFPR